MNLSTTRIHSVISIRPVQNLAVMTLTRLVATISTPATPVLPTYPSCSSSTVSVARPTCGPASSPTSVPTSLTHTKTTVVQTKLDGDNGTEFTTKTVTETETSDHQGITRTITTSQKQQERHTSIESLHGSSSEDSSYEAPSLEMSKLKVRQSFTLLSNGEH